MEIENSDLNDRNLMGLYGLNPDKPTVYDHHKNPEIIRKFNEQLQKFNQPHTSQIVDLKIGETEVKIGETEVNSFNSQSTGGSKQSPRVKEDQEVLN